MARKRDVAHEQRLVPLHQLDAKTTFEIAKEAGDRVGVDHRASVDLPEDHRVELVEQLAQGHSDQRFALGRDRARAAETEKLCQRRRSVGRFRQPASFAADGGHLLPAVAWPSLHCRDLP
jgi:hypothetical protein